MPAVINCAFPLKKKAQFCAGYRQAQQKIKYIPRKKDLKIRHIWMIIV